MADSKPAEVEAAVNPAEVPMSDAPVASAPEVTAGAQEDSTSKVANIDTVDTKTEEKSAEEKAAVSEESSAVGSEEKVKTTEKEKDGDDSKGNRDRGKYDRNAKRGGGHQNNQRNKKPRSDKPNEFADLAESDNHDEIRQQVEFYFSLNNLRIDQHMFEEIEGPENRPVSIKHLTTFKRMRRFQPYSAVVAALRESPSLVVVDDGKFAGAGNEGVRRKEPLVVPDYEKDKRYKPDIIELFHRFKKQTRSFLDCSIYAKGFGDEKDAGQIKLEEFFKPYGAIATRKRRDEDEKWKGSVFVEFDTEDEAKQFLALDPMPKYNDNELLAMSKKDYVAMKCKEKGITPSWETDKNFEDRRGQHRGGRGGGRGRGGRGRGGDRGRGRGRGRGNSDRRGGGRDRSPRERRDRSGSPDSRDWNGRRDKFQNSKDFKGGRRGEKPAALPKDPNNPYGFELDERGIPVVQTTTKASQIDISSNDNKRKADKGDEEVIPKKAKIEIKEDA